MASEPWACTSETKAARGKKKGKNHYTTVEMVPCKVCGKKSSGYHFGAVTCEACKAFYRRTLCRNSSIPKYCRRGDSKCRVDLTIITGCPACRLARCIEQGMSKEGARKGRYSLRLRNMSIIEAKRVETEQQKFLCMNAPSADNSKTTTLLQVGSARFLVPDGNLLGPNGSDCSGSDIQSSRSQSVIVYSGPFNNTVQSDSEVDRGRRNLGLQAINEGQKSAKFISSDINTGDNTTPLDCSSESIRLSTGDVQPPSLPDPFSRDVREIDHVISELIHLQKKLYPHPVLTEDIEIKQRQIEEEHKQREETYRYLFGSSEYVSATEFKEVLNEMNIELDDRLALLRDKARKNEKNIVLYVRHSKSIPGFDTLDVNDVLKLLKGSYYEFWLFSNHIYINGETGVSGGTESVINAHKKTVSSLFPKEYVEGIFSFADSLRKLKLTLEEVAIIRVIVLTFTDRCDLKHPEQVQKLHNLFTNCLLYQLSKTKQNCRQRFCQIMERLVEVRSLTHMNRSVNQKFLKDWSFVVKEFPLWREMMSAAPKYE